MSKFDALIHAFTTMGLGGFSSHDASFGHFNSALIEMVCVVFMLIAGVNFATHFLAFRTRSPAAYRHGDGLTVNPRTLLGPANGFLRSANGAGSSPPMGRWCS